MEVVSDVATTCLSWKQVCACKQTSVTFILRHCVLLLSGTLEKWPRM